MRVRSWGCTASTSGWRAWGASPPSTASSCRAGTRLSVSVVVSNPRRSSSFAGVREGVFVPVTALTSHNGYGRWWVDDRSQTSKACEAQASVGSNPTATAGESPVADHGNRGFDVRSHFWWQLPSTRPVRAPWWQHPRRHPNAALRPSRRPPRAVLSPAEPRHAGWSR
jgi:hypothetical protein